MTEEEFWRLTFLEAHLLTQQYVWRVEREQHAAALFLWSFSNVHRDTAQQPEPYTWEDMRTLLGYSPVPTAAPVAPPEPDALKERMAGFVAYWNAIPDGPPPR